MKIDLKLAILGFGILTVAGCHTDMWVQPKVHTQGTSEFFADHMANREEIPGTVARGHDKSDTAFFKGRQNGKLVDKIPLERAMKELGTVDFKAFLHRGQERFTIYCTPCHGQLGDGNGMITQRGLALKKKPASYHTDRLRKMPVGHFFDVMTHGYGIMYSYATRVEPADRWAVAAYIRALQLSQNAKSTDLTPEDIQKMSQPNPEETPAR